MAISFWKVQQQHKSQIFFFLLLCTHTCARRQPAPCCTADLGVCSWGACHWCRTTGNRLQHGAPLLHRKLRGEKKQLIYWICQKKIEHLHNAGGVCTSTDLTPLAGEAAGFQSETSGWECRTCEPSWAPFLPRGSYQTWDLPDPEQKEGMTDIVAER